MQFSLHDNDQPPIDIAVRRRRGLRRISLYVRPFQPIRISAPRGVSDRQILKFLQSQRVWLIRKVEEKRIIEESRERYPDAQSIRSRWHRGELVAAPDARPGFHIDEHKIRISYPKQLPIHDESVQRLIRRSLTEAYRLEAKAILPSRVAALSQKHQLPFNQLRIKNMKTRWGSCSSRQNINLNLHLMRLPDRLVDYVVCHELLHTVIPNHSPLYWQRLEQICPGALSCRRQLKNYCLSLWVD